MFAAEFIGKRQMQRNKCNQTTKKKKEKKRHYLMYTPRKKILFLEIIHFVGKGRGGFGGIYFKTGMERRKWVYEAIFIVFILFT